MSSMVEIPFLILAEPIVVFIVGRAECGSNAIERQIVRPAVVVEQANARLAVHLRHLPTLDCEKRRSVASRDRHIRSTAEGAEVLPRSVPVRSGGPAPWWRRR